MTKKYKNNNKKFYMNTIVKLNMRSGPSKEDDVLIIIPKG